MYLDEKNEWRPLGPPERPRLSERGQRVIGWLIAVNLGAMIIAPIGGATVIEILAYWLTR